MMAEWEQVRDPADRRRVVYWRLRGGGRSIGAVSRRAEAGLPWHATCYPVPGRLPRPPAPADFATRGEAEAVVLAYWESIAGASDG